MGDTGIRRSIVSRLSTLYPGLYSDSKFVFVERKLMTPT